MDEHVTVVIPTRNRWEKLGKTLESIPIIGGVSTFVMCDGHPPRDDIKVDDSTWIFSTDKHVGATHCRNLTLSLYCLTGAALCATDDVVFHDGAIEAARDALYTQFPDGDGVIGFVQEPGSFHRTGVVLVGQKWLQRYPHRWMYFPGYWHFACQEIDWLATKLNKFYQCKDAVLTHLHPGYNPREMDQTHTDARLHFDIDRAVRNRRHDAGLIWGDF